MEIQIAFWIMVGIKVCEILQRIADLEQRTTELEQRLAKTERLGPFFQSLAKREVQDRRRLNELEDDVKRLH